MPASDGDSSLSGGYAVPVASDFHFLETRRNGKAAISDELAGVLSGTIEDDIPLAELHQPLLVNEVPLVDLQYYPPGMILPMKMRWMLTRKRENLAVFRLRHTTDNFRSDCKPVCGPMETPIACCRIRNE